MGTTRLVRDAGRATAAAIAIAITTSAARAEIDVLLEVTGKPAACGELVEVALSVVSDDDGDQLTSALQVIIAWDPEILVLVGHFDTGAPLLFSDFPEDPFGLNEDDPPLDGDGIYVAFGELGEPIAATPTGTLITTFVFHALEPARTPIDIVATAGSPEAHTIVFDGTVPNLDVTGLLAGAVAIVTAAPTCPEDLDCDGAVSITDLLILLGAWGSNPGHPADLDGDDQVAILDLLDLLAAWGPCPP